MRELFEELGSYEAKGELLLAGAVPDHRHWYRKKTSDEALPAELQTSDTTFIGRPMCATVDWPEYNERLTRSYYTTTTYTSASFLLDAWTPGRWNNETEQTEWFDGASETWGTNNPLPGYADIEALSLFVDVDLNDEVKASRHDDQAVTTDSFDRSTVETAIEFTVDRFTTLTDERGCIFCLDSGGGFYVMLPPAVTRPFFDALDSLAVRPESRGAFVDDLVTRFNQWLGEVEAGFLESTPSAVDMLKFDAVNNKNRQFKPPLSVHTTYDVVVHPLSPSSPRYARLPLQDVTAEHIDAARRWAATFTADREEFRAAARRLAALLFPEAYTVRGETVQGTVQAWVNAHEEAVTEKRQATEEATLRRQTDPRVFDETGDSPSGIPGSVTPYFHEVEKAIDDLDTEAVAEATIVTAWNDNKGGGSDKRHFYPVWGPDSNGSATFVNLAGGFAIDTGAGNALIGKPKMALIAVEGDSYHGGAASGADWRRGVQYLREVFGFDVPAHVPERGTKKPDGTIYERTPLWALCDAAVTFGTCSRDDLIEKTSEDGATYWDLPAPWVYNATLEALDEVSIDHNRQRRGTGTTKRSPRRILEQTRSTSDSPAGETPPDEWVDDVLLDLLGG
ncbi:hypothetical protein [Halomarina ordinaria]|uniref:Uncharacterized protein n=1 Tax=Halomarina ordinaria TaxID=3033939 RepID=A0ABD5UCG9_9EURY|nr:hypothetical protein [Halomarina sp. PSRA2]